MRLSRWCLLAGMIVLAGCGGNPSQGRPDGATEDAAVTDGAGHDAAPDDAASIDGAPDDGSPADGPAADAGPAPRPRFLTPTAGGARLQSASYRVDLFVAPAPPVGARSSASYRFRLGPGALSAEP